jgi:hypothetical protein
MRDGFSFTDAERIDTEDEVVECGVCGRRFPLGELDEDVLVTGGGVVGAA